MRAIFPPNNPEGRKLFDEAMLVRSKLHTGNLTVDQAIEKVKPYIEWFNDHAKSIAAKYNKRAPQMRATAFLK